MTHRFKKTLIGAVAALGLAASAPAPVMAQSGKLIINSGLSQPADKVAFQQMVDAFEKAHPNIHVTVNVYGHEDEKIAIRNWLVADPPDLVYWYPGVRMLKFVKPHLFAPVSAVWKQVGLQGKVAPGVTEQLTHGGQQWGMPYAYYMWGMYYRKDILAKYHIAVPKTWQEFLAACATLKKNGVTPIALGDQELWPAAGWFDYLDMRTNGYAAHEALMHGKISYAAPSVKKVFDEWANLAAKGYFTPNSTSYKWQDAQALLFNGKAAMFLIGSFMLPDIPANLQSKIGFFQFPVINPKAGPGEDAPIDMMAMPQGAKDKKNAEAFMAFMAQPDAQAKLDAAIGELPVLTSAEVAPNPLLAQQAKLLATVPHFAQFYDRDNESAMSKYGMQQFQRLLYDPKQVNAVVKSMAAEEARVYHTKAP
jgi:multiple sugar transport system substrate-binding protein